jgi:hypothetical protein
MKPLFGDANSETSEKCFNWILASYSPKKKHLIWGKDVLTRNI